MNIVVSVDIVSLTFTPRDRYSEERGYRGERSSFDVEKLRFEKKEKKISRDSREDI